MTAFQQKFGDKCDTKGVCTIGTENLSLLNSAGFITYAAALFVASLMGEALGRRVVYVVMNVICLIGVGVTYSAQNYGQLLAGRMIVNIYTGMESWLVPLFIAETVPTQIRGSLVALYMFCRLLGTLIISCVSYSTSTLKDDMAWKIPITVLFSVPAFALLATYFIPESPRWLVLKGRDDTAKKNLSYINDGRAGFDLDTEIAIMKHAIELHAEQGSWADMVRGSNLVSHSISKSYVNPTACPRHELT